MTARERPVCQAGPSWVRDQLKDKQALASLTGQDSRALQSFFHLLSLYSVSDETGEHSAVLGMACCVCAMQPKTRHLAKAGIPQVLDWSDEEPLWRRIQNEVEGVERALFAVRGQRTWIGAGR